MISQTTGLLCIAILLVAVSCNCNPSIVSKKDTVNKVDTLKRGIAKQDASLPDISGFYKALSDNEAGNPCNLSVKIMKLKNEYRYIFNMPDSVIKGKVTVSAREEANSPDYTIIFEGIKWASYEGDISDQDENSAAFEPENIPVGITAVFSNNEIKFQNYGNSMNSYTIIEGCDQKYIRMVKQ